MQIRKLTQKDFFDLLQAINGSFADYIVPFQLDNTQLEFKIISEDIVFEWSVGIFEENQLVAFMMHGVRKTEDKTIVYNAGTGVLPEYRGQGLVGKMYEYILPFLKENNVQQLVLEVIEDNHSAIRAYEKNGFFIQRKLLCFDGKLEVKPVSNLSSVQPLKDFYWKKLQSFWDITPSWQSSAPTMDVIEPVSLGAFIDEKLVGYLLFCPIKKRIYQIAVTPEYRRKGIATQLLAEVQQQISNEKVQLNNMDEAAENLKLFFEKQGLINDINQFEMVKNL